MQVTGKRLTTPSHAPASDAEVKVADSKVADGEAAIPDAGGGRQDGDLARDGGRPLGSRLCARSTRACAGVGPGNFVDGAAALTGSGGIDRPLRVNLGC